MSVAAPLLILLFLASAFPWLLVFRSRFGHLIAIPATAAGALCLLLGVLLASAQLHWNYLACLVGASVITAAVGGYLARRTPGALRRPSRYAIALWCPALLGAVIWILTVTAAQIVPGASRFGWAMNGDALNNLHYASVIVHANGIVLGAFENPVPLPAALIAVGVGAGSPDSTGAGAALAQQLSGFTLSWTILLAITCVAMGVVCASVLPSKRIRTVALISALGSLLPLTWFVSGLTVQWGYFNIDLVLPLLFGAWIVYIGANRHPVPGLIVLLAFAFLALAVWTPIVLIVAALGVGIVARFPAKFVSVRGWALVFLVAGFASACAFIGFATVPTIVAQYKSLAASGSGFLGFPNLWWPVPILVGFAVVTALLARRQTRLPVLSATICVLVGACLAVGVVLYFARPNSDIFSAYYPKKLAWIMLVVLGALVISFIVGAVAGRVRPVLLSMIVVLGLVAGVVVPPGTWPEALQRQPVARILGDYVRLSGENTVDTILKYTTWTHSTILWRSGAPDEPIINEWLLLARGGLVSGDKKLITAIGDQYFLYRAAGRYSDSSVSALCREIGILPGRATVVTASADVAPQLRATCPEAGARVVIDRSLQGPLPAKTGQDWQFDGIEGPID